MPAGYRDHPALRAHPRILAPMARQHVSAATRDGYATARAGAGRQAVERPAPHTRPARVAIRAVRGGPRAP
ncbi:hypothetical protein [Embleya sp. NPDC020630]|uniref:hypothetical protein n=1 Tax=Embleya sp. NPDC020630 TaxID=3363979 RepID=UPI0037A52225